jgi:hypothetical protein
MIVETPYADTQSGRSLIRSTAIALIVLKKMEASGNSGRMPADGLGVKKDFEPRAHQRPCSASFRVLYWWKAS